MNRSDARAASPTEVPTVRGPRWRYDEIAPVRLAGGALTLLAVLLLTFVGQVTLLSHLRYERAQQTAYADFRAQLAEATAPVGPTGLDDRLLTPGTPVAVLEIPAVRARQVVFEGTSSQVLQDGPGHRRDTPLPGQPGTSVLLGRRAAYGGPFSGIRLLRPGHLIIATTGQGRHEYRVRGVRRPGDPVPPAPGPGAGRLTLMTAGGLPFLPEDILRVDADLSTAAQELPARRLDRQALPPAEEAMGADDGAWVPLVLWGQLLLVAGYGVTWAWTRWGGPQAWVVGVPVLAAVGLSVADQVTRLLPNLY